ncbi:MAG: GNAT family N-acetyltransferase [Chloroflexota bacterium]
MTITLSDAPPIPGLRFRGIQRPADDAAIAQLVNAGMVANGIPHRFSLAQFSSWLDHPTNLDLAADLLFAEVNGSVVAYTEGGWEQDNDGGRNYQVWGQVHPDWQRRGLGTALLRWTEERQRRVAAAHPDVDKRLQSWASEAEAGRLALLEGHGYEIVRYDYEMERPTLDDIQPLPFPAGIELRPARDEHLRRIWETEIEVFRDHWGAIDDSEASFERTKSDPRRDMSLWVVAWQGDEIVGQVLNRIDKEANAELGVRRGWLSSVGVRRAWRRQGIGRALVAESLRVLRDAGMTSAGLGVDAENANGALGVYETSGFRVVRTERVYRKTL